MADLGSFSQRECQLPCCVHACRPLSREEQDFAAQPTQFHGIFSRVLPVALRLACGPEPVARQLFEPLTMSLVHWFNRAARRWAWVAAPEIRDVAAALVEHS